MDGHIKDVLASNILCFKSTAEGCPCDKYHNLKNMNSVFWRYVNGPGTYI